MATLQIKNNSFYVEDIILVQQSIYATDLDDYWSTDFELPASSDLCSAFGWTNILCADFDVVVDGVIHIGTRQYECEIKALSISEGNIQMTLTASKYERLLSRPICDVEFDWEQQDPENRHDDWFTLNDTIDIGVKCRPKQQDEYLESDVSNILLYNLGYSSVGVYQDLKQFFPTMGLGDFVCSQLERSNYTYDDDMYDFLQQYTITVDKLRVTKSNPYFFMDYKSRNDTENHSCRYADSAFFDDIQWYSVLGDTTQDKGCSFKCNTDSTWSYWFHYKGVPAPQGWRPWYIKDLTEGNIIANPTVPESYRDYILEGEVNFVAEHEYCMYVIDADDPSHNDFDFTINMKLKELAPDATYDTANDHDIDFANNNYNWENVNRGIFGFRGCFDSSLQKVMRDIEIVFGVRFNISLGERHVSFSEKEIPIPIKGWVDSYEFGSDLFANKSLIEDSVGREILVSESPQTNSFDLKYLDDENTIIQTNCRIPVKSGAEYEDPIDNEHPIVVVTTFKVKSRKNPKIYIPYSAEGDDEQNNILSYQYGNYFFAKKHSISPVWLENIENRYPEILLPRDRSKVLTAKIYSYDEYNGEKLIHFEGRDWLVNEAEIDNNGLILLTCTLN